MRTGTHCELFYHFIWTTKDRVAMIDPEIEVALKKVFNSKAKDLHFTILEVNGTGDHIHILVESTPSLAPADIAKHLKGSSSHFVNHEILKEDKFRTFYWQDGYGVISVSPQAVTSVKKYIQNQKEHHSKQNLRSELEQFS